MKHDVQVSGEGRDMKVRIVLTPETVGDAIEVERLRKAGIERKGPDRERKEAAT